MVQFFLDQKRDSVDPVSIFCYFIQQILVKNMTFIDFDMHT